MVWSGWWPEWSEAAVSGSLDHHSWANIAIRLLGFRSTSLGKEACASSRFASLEGLIGRPSMLRNGLVEETVRYWKQTPRAGSDLKPGTIIVREFHGETRQ